MKAWEPGAPRTKGRGRWNCQIKKRHRILSNCPSIFLFSVPSMDRMLPVHAGRVGSLSRLTDSDANLFLNTFTNTPRKNVLPTIWMSLSPAKLTYNINHQRGILCLWTKALNYVRVSVFYKLLYKDNSNKILILLNLTRWLYNGNGNAKVQA